MPGSSQIWVAKDGGGAFDFRNWGCANDHEAVTALVPGYGRELVIAPFLAGLSALPEWVAQKAMGAPSASR